MLHDHEDFGLERDDKKRTKKTKSQGTTRKTYVNVWPMARLNATTSLPEPGVGIVFVGDWSIGELERM